MELQKQNKMGVMPVNKLLVTMALPMVASMLVQALYNVVDSYFVSMVSREALTAVSQAFSAQNLMIGIATGTAVGMNALISRSLGERNYDKANKIAATGVLLGGFGYLLMLLFGIFGTDLYFTGMLSSSQNDGLLDLARVQADGNAYLSICCIFSFGIYGQIIFERMMQATGRTIYTMYTQGIGAIINIILDPIFILDNVPVIGGLGLGAAGAAIATVVGQIVACILAVVFNSKVNTDIKIKIKDMRPDFKIIKSIYSIGIPSIIMMGIGSVMFYLMNIIVMGVSAVGATIFGVYYKLQSFILMPTFGFNNAMIPILGYNYGAQNKKRITKTIKLSISYVLIIMVAGILMMQLIPGTLIGLFESDPDVISLGSTAMRIISLNFVFAGFCIVLGSVFQAFGYGLYSMIVSIARQLVVLVPVAYILAQFGNLNLIWFSFPIAEIMSLTVTLILFARIYKKVIKKIPDGNL
ncbi:MAG: MATE family efflux transporter [Clostridia bacterium]|nr:MATE family efflux transporter [Clostridia bacterium]